MRLTRIAGAGHYTGTFSAAELFAALYYAELRYRPDEPDWPDRDRFVLSKGHAAIGLYPVLADRRLLRLRACSTTTPGWTAPFGDHPDMRKIAGHRLQLRFARPRTVGDARHGARRAGPAGLPRSYCVMGDGELAEGQIWEAAMAAGQFQAGSLVGIVDRNHLSIDGDTESIMSVEPLADTFDSLRLEGPARSTGTTRRRSWTSRTPAREPRERPSCMIADTVKGRGVRRMEGDTEWHVGNLLGADYDDVIAEIEAGLQPVGRR